MYYHGAWITSYRNRGARHCLETAIIAVDEISREIAGPSINHVQAEAALVGSYSPWL
jgi:hypothetical protein